MRKSPLFTALRQLAARIFRRGSAPRIQPLDTREQQLLERHRSARLQRRQEAQP